MRPGTLAKALGIPGYDDRYDPGPGDIHVSLLWVVKTAGLTWSDYWGFRSLHYGLAACTLKRPPTVFHDLIMVSDGLDRMPTCKRCCVLWDWALERGALSETSPTATPTPS